VPRRSRILLPSILLASLRVGMAPTAGWCDDVLKVAVGAPNNWDSGVPDVGQRAGIFKKRGLRLEILYTNCGGETMQAVISGSADIGIAAGTAGVFGAFAKGAPVRILLAGTTGAGDLYWYVPAQSPINSFADLDGKTVGYSTNGASTQTTLLALIKHFKVTAKPVATGAAALTMTQAMSKQVDVGWASPPFGLDALDEGKNPPDRPRKRRTFNARSNRPCSYRQCRCAGEAPRCRQSLRRGLSRNLPMALQRSRGSNDLFGLR
jgi:NitT/TauT family transport system substrate-binding protein